MPLILRRTLEYSYDRYNQIPKADPTLVLHFNTQIPNDEKDTILYDYSIYGNNGQIYGAQWTPEGLKVDGVDDYVEVGHSNVLNLPDAFTLICWGKIVDTSPEQWIISKRGTLNPNSGYFLGVGGNHILSGYYQSGVGWKIKSGGVSLGNNIWRFYTSTWDGATLRLYVDGQTDLTLATGGSVETNTEPLNIGRCSADSYRVYGLIGEVRIYSRALSADEILALYNKTKSLYLYRRGYL